MIQSYNTITSLIARPRVQCSADNHVMFNKEAVLNKLVSLLSGVEVVCCYFRAKNMNANLRVLCLDFISFHSCTLKLFPLLPLSLSQCSLAEFQPIRDKRMDPTPANRKL